MSVEVKVRENGVAAVAKKIRRVLVTGAAGCVGSYLVEELLAGGYEVIADAWFDALTRPRSVSGQ